MLHQTFIGMAIYVAVAAIIGLLVIKYARWRQPNIVTRPAGERDTATPGMGCGVALTIVVVVVVLVLLGLWVVSRRP